jgi:hypothetical protein
MTGNLTGNHPKITAKYLTKPGFNFWLGCYYRRTYLGGKTPAKTRYNSLVTLLGVVERVGWLLVELRRENLA